MRVQGGRVQGERESARLCALLCYFVLQIQYLTLRVVENVAVVLPSLDMNAVPCECAHHLAFTALLRLRKHSEAKGGGVRPRRDPELCTMMPSDGEEDTLTPQSEASHQARLSECNENHCK